MPEELTVIQQIAILVIQIGVIIFAAKFCGDLAKKFKMPGVLGELLAGILIGPYLLGQIGIGFHGFEHGLFPLCGGELPVSLSLYSIATLGSIILLFMSGLETDLEMFFRYSVVGTVVGIGGVIFSFAFGIGIGYFMFNTSLMDPRCLFLGILCTATSVGITARILSERKQIDSPEGVTILAAAVIDDVLCIICLAIVMGIVEVSGCSDPEKTIDWGKIGLIAAKSMGIWLIVTALGLIFARNIAKFLRSFKNPAVFAGLSFGMALLLAGLFEQVGLAMIVGAYVMGLSLSKTDVSFAIQNALHPLYNFLVPVFFVVMGMLVDIRVMADPDVLMWGLLYTLLAVAAKVLGCALPAFFMNFNALGALRIGAGMIPRGEVALIIAGIGATTMMQLNGKNIPILDSRLFGIAIIMTLGTTVLAPPLLAFVLNLKGKGVRHEIKDSTVIHTAFKFPSPPITEFVMRHLMESFDREGFMTSSFDKDTELLHFRRDNLSFSLILNENEFVFASNPDEVIFIKEIMYETLVELHQSLGKLKELAKPQEFQQKIFHTAAENSPAEPTEQPKSSLPMMEKVILPSCVQMELSATTKDGVIEELMDLLVREHRVIDKNQCMADVLEREHVISTCMPGGIALPHGRSDGTEELVAAIGIRKEGYHFDSMDGQPTKIFVLCVSPKNSNGPHIQFIAGVASVFTVSANIDAILAAKTPEEVVDIFVKKKKTV